MGKQGIRAYATWAAGAVAAVTLGACNEQGPAPTPSLTAAPTTAPEAAPTVAAERARLVYLPLGAESTEFGPLTVLLPPGNVGSGRTYNFGNGAVLEAELLAVADVTKTVGNQSMAAALGLTDAALSNNGDPRTYLLKVNTETTAPGGAKMCGDAATAFLLFRQLDTPADRTMTIAMLTAEPGAEGARVCKKLVYTAQ